MGCALWCRPLTIQVAVKNILPLELVIWNEWCLHQLPEKPGTILGRRSKIESKTENTEQHLKSKATNWIEVKPKWHRCDTDVPPLHPHRKHNSRISTFELFVFWNKHQIYVSDSHQLHKKWDSRWFINAQKARKTTQWTNTNSAIIQTQRNEQTNHKKPNTLKTNNTKQQNETSLDHVLQLTSPESFRVLVSRVLVLSKLNSYPSFCTFY